MWKISQNFLLRKDVLTFLSLGTLRPFRFLESNGNYDGILLLLKNFTSLGKNNYVTKSNVKNPIVITFYYQLRFKYLNVLLSKST